MYISLWVFACPYKCSEARGKSQVLFLRSHPLVLWELCPCWWVCEKELVWLILQRSSRGLSGPRGASSWDSYHLGVVGSATSQDWACPGVAYNAKDMDVGSRQEHKLAPCPWSDCSVIEGIFSVLCLRDRLGCVWLHWGREDKNRADSYREAIGHRI